MSAFSRIAASFIAAQKLAKARDVKDYLDRANRAEAPLDPELRKNHPYSKLLWMTHGEWMEDGEYLCSCGAENKLHHFEGRYPFKYLRCDVCNRIFDAECISSEILTPIPRSCIPSRGVTKNLAHGMGQFCPQCGLTHRVELIDFTSIPSLHVYCQCGSRSTPDWFTFFINSPDTYRYDPNAAHVRLKEEWASKATEKVLGKQVPLLREIQTTRAKATKIMVPNKPTRSTVSAVQTPPRRQIISSKGASTGQWPTQPFTAKQPTAVCQKTPTFNNECTINRPGGKVLVKRAGIFDAGDSVLKI
ncbi:hypothetical protein DE146DRAFT_787713 [Phaeosphaeria sp. MPI-PUGE-AT-0046c]|nr:hypothetical protein DE146DRAFT_787713 [Phaeosphaeria sp. MPI-PUGE-AT-0046c]